MRRLNHFLSSSHYSAIKIIAEFLPQVIMYLHHKKLLKLDNDTYELLLDDMFAYFDCIPDTAHRL